MKPMVSLGNQEEKEYCFPNSMKNNSWQVFPKNAHAKILGEENDRFKTALRSG